MVLTCEFVDRPSRFSAREMSESTSWYVFEGGKYGGTLGSCIIPSILLPWWFTVTDTRFSMTIYVVFHDARKANTEDHLCVFITYTKTKSNIFSN